MSDDLDRIRKEAARRKAEGAHETHEAGEHDKREGARAAHADFDYILRELDKRVHATGMRFHIMTEGDGDKTYSLPRGYRSQAGGLKYPVVLDNSSAFMKAYGAVIQELLGGKDDPFFVDAGAHGVDGHLYITWKEPQKGGGGH